MTRLVTCRKLGKQLPGLASPPMPGPMGEDIYEHVSAEAWDQWQTLQTMLINEHQLRTSAKLGHGSVPWVGSMGRQNSACTFTKCKFNKM